MFGLEPVASSDQNTTEIVHKAPKPKVIVNVDKNMTSQSFIEMSQSSLNQPTGTLNEEGLLNDAENEELAEEPNPPDQPNVDDAENVGVGDQLPQIDVVWLLKNTFNNLNEFNKFIDEPKIWKKHRTEKLNKGIKTTFRCGATKRRGRQCAAGGYSIYDFEPNNEQVRWFEKNLDHDHENHPNIRSSVSDAVKEEIISLKSKGETPKGILFKLQQRTDIVVPSKSQIDNVIDMHKKKNIGQAKTTMNELIKFYEDHREIPEDDDTPFIASFERSAKGQIEKWFRFFVTTKRLLKNGSMGDIICADGTYKTTIQKYPIIVVGTVDMAQSFHLTGLTISTHERAEDFRFVFDTLKETMQRVTGKTINPKLLIADAAPAIHKGFKDSFLVELIIMCWFHVTLNVNKQKFQSTANNEAIMNDLRAVHYLCTEELFEVGIKLFNAKWMPTESLFVKYFQGSFVDRNRNWFHGAAHRVPSTNNACESFNGSMKIHQTHFLQKNLSEFKEHALQIVQQRSAEYVRVKDPKPFFVEQVPIAEDVKVRGLLLAKANNQFHYKKAIDETTIEYYCHSTSLK